LTSAVCFGGVSQTNYGINVHHGEDSHSLNISSSTSKQVQTYPQWSVAFDTYMAIYCMKYTDQCGELLKYKHRIEALQCHGPDVWRMYDEEFRRFKSESKVLFPWASAIPDLENQLVRQQATARQVSHSKSVPPFPKNNGYRPPFRSASKGKVPPNFCYAFGEGRLCRYKNRCKFHHYCWRCNGPHSGHRCTANSGTRPSGKPTSKPGANSRPGK